MALLITVLIGLFVIYALFFQGGHMKFFDDAGVTSTQQNQELKPINPALDAPIQGEAPIIRLSRNHSHTSLDSDLSVHATNPVLIPLVRTEKMPETPLQETNPSSYAVSHAITPLRAPEENGPPVPVSSRQMNSRPKEQIASSRNNNAPPVPMSSDNPVEQGEQAQ